MSSERRNVWKVCESKDIYDDIMKMNEWEREKREHQSSSTAVKRDDVEFDFLTDLHTDIATISAPIQSDDDAFERLKFLIESFPNIEKDELENIFSNTNNGFKYDFSASEGNLRNELNCLTESFIKLDRDELESYSSAHEALMQYHQQFRSQCVLQCLKTLDDKPEQLDSLTESFVKLEMDELENYSATHEAVIQYRQQFRQYVRDNLNAIEDKVLFFLKEWWLYL